MDGKEYIERSREMLERVDKLNKIANEVRQEQVSKIQRYEDLIAALQTKIANLETSVAVLEAKVAGLQMLNTRMGPKF